MYEVEREIASRIVAEVCDLTRRVQDDIVAAGESLTKDDRSPVTLGDLAAQVVVSRRLAERFPSDRLVGEEDSAALAATPTMAERALRLVHEYLPELTHEAMLEALDRGSYEGGGQGRHWVLDPIDGTKGFLRGEQYAVALALVDDGRVVVGALGCPNLPPAFEPDSEDRGCLFDGARGAGVRETLIGRDDGREIRVDSVTDPAQAVVCESVEAAHAAHLVQGAIANRLGITTDPFRVDSQCKYAVVARGEASIYLRLPRDSSYREKVWDHAAGKLVIEEAGGRVTDLEGEPLDFSQGRLLGNRCGIVATNGAIHDKVLEACRAELGLD
jgi:HAL2 family 3'(2'),5'-bisphosphate nucleotidase